jgi:sugar lactone lactonase YvrE
MIIAEMAEIVCLVEARNLVGEGPLWHPEHEALYWTDINGFRVYRYRPSDGSVADWKFNEPVCALSTTTDPDRVLVALGSRVILWRPDSGAEAELARPEPRIPFNRLNDGATDPAGAFWVGSMRNNVGPGGGHLEVEGHTGSLYRVGSDGRVTVGDTGFGITNTVGWSPDGRTFYCGCSLGNVVFAYDFDASSGALANRRPFFADFRRGVPDGSAVDADGFLWNCRYGGGCVVRISPDGSVERIVELPVANVTNCAFGEQDLRTLYVVTASLGVGSDEPLAGALFALRTDVAGLPTSPFRIEASR